MTRFKGGSPAGTIETVAGVCDGTDVLQRAPQTTKDGSSASSLDAKPEPPRGRTKVASLFAPLQRSTTFRQWTAPFFMAPTNSSVVRRTNTLLGYAPNLTYSERWGFPDMGGALTIFLGLYVMALPWVGLPLLRGILRLCNVLPGKSAGAKAVTEKECTAGSVSFLVGASGTSKSGLPATTALRFSGLGDPAVIHTAVCQGEIAALLAQASTADHARPGTQTPVSAVGGERLRGALEKTGMVLIEAVEPALLR